MRARDTPEITPDCRKVSENALLLTGQKATKTKLMAFSSFLSKGRFRWGYVEFNDGP
jgi:hypothetical protein